MKNPLRNFRFNKTWAVLSVSLLVGTLAALAARSYLSNQMAAIEARSQGETVSVVVAKTRLQIGEQISSDTVAVRAVPADYAHSNALLPSQFDAFDGKVLAFSVNGGEMVLWSMLEGKKSPTFSARVDVGHRAISVPVDEINSISGLLEPGDLIDLMVTINQRDKKYTVPLLQTVRVMATGQRSMDDPKSGERRQYSTVTLAATPEQAQNVIVAREAGKLTALLRNPGDKQIFSGGNTDLASLLGLLPEADLQPQAAALAVRQVPVLYGGRGALLPPEGLQMGQYVQARNVALPAPLPEPTPPAEAAATAAQASPFAPAAPAPMPEPEAQPRMPAAFQSPNLWGPPPLRLPGSGSSQPGTGKPSNESTAPVAPTVR